MVTTGDGFLLSSVAGVSSSLSVVFLCLVELPAQPPGGECLAALNHVLQTRILLHSQETHPFKRLVSSPLLFGERVLDSSC